MSNCKFATSQTSHSSFFYSYGVLENVDKAQTKVRAKKENVAGKMFGLSSNAFP